MTYLFDFDQFENLHEIINHLIQFQAPGHDFLKMHNAWSVSWFLELFEWKLNFLEKVHHIHLIHESLQSCDGFTPMLLNNGQAFILVKFLIISLINHVLKWWDQIFYFDFTVDIIILMCPSPMLQELLIHWSFGPISILKDPE